jgi:hypothetical protein
MSLLWYLKRNLILLIIFLETEDSKVWTIFKLVIKFSIESGLINTENSSESKLNINEIIEKREYWFTWDIMIWSIIQKDKYEIKSNFPF